MFSADLGADLAANTELQEILLEHFEQCIITDHHKSFEVDWIDGNKISYINLNDEKDANYYSGAFTSALVFSQIFQIQTTPLEEELIAITLLSDRIDLDNGDNLDMVLNLAQAKLIIETPREVLKNAELSQIEEILTGCIFNGAYRLQNDLKGNRYENFKQN